MEFLLSEKLEISNLSTCQFQSLCGHQVYKIWNIVTNSKNSKDHIPKKSVFYLLSEKGFGSIWWSWLVLRCWSWLAAVSFYTRGLIHLLPYHYRCFTYLHHLPGLANAWVRGPQFNIEDLWRALSRRVTWSKKSFKKQVKRQSDTWK